MSLFSNSVPSKLSMKTDQLLSEISFTSSEILKILQNLDPNKAHDYDMISIQMLKICGSTVCKPFELILSFVSKIEHILHIKKKINNC